MCRHAPGSTAWRPNGLLELHTLTYNLTDPFKETITRLSFGVLSVVLAAGALIDQALRGSIIWL